MASFGGNNMGSQLGGSGGGEYVYIKKKPLTIGSYQAISRYSGANPSYNVKSDVDETVSAIWESSIYTQSADGESPQLQAIVSSGEGGGGKGHTVINPRPTITVNTVVSGATQNVGITGI